ncbi:MAG: LysM peptidoglycan-binding domain-containing protein, partial [Chloroflexota bacterium]
EIVDPILIYAGQVIALPPRMRAASRAVAAQAAPSPPSEPAPPTGDETSIPAPSPPPTYTIRTGDRLSNIAKSFEISLEALLAVNPEIGNPDLIYAGQQLVIPSKDFVPPPQPEPAAPPPAPVNPPGDERWIDVDLSDQAVYAYDGGELVRSFVVSTGLARFPTITGEFHIYVKHLAVDMRGPDYFLEDVPYTMYFYKGYGLHGTYWHDNFGVPMSHGCVNLSISDAEWLFEFAEVGTVVRVHE